MAFIHSHLEAAKSEEQKKNTCIRKEVDFHRLGSAEFTERQHTDLDYRSHCTIRTTIRAREITKILARSYFLPEKAISE